LHFPTDGEILRELFERGPLQKFDDDMCRHRVLARYREVRPVGEQLDCDMEKRAREYVESLPKLRKIQSRLKTGGSHGWKTLRDDVQRVNSRQLTDTGLQLSDSASRDESMAPDACPPLLALRAARRGGELLQSAHAGQAPEPEGSRSDAHAPDAPTGARARRHNEPRTSSAQQRVVGNRSRRTGGGSRPHGASLASTTSRQRSDLGVARRRGLTVETTMRTHFAANQRPGLLNASMIVTRSR
jgi:hypothetical protein